MKLRLFLLYFLSLVINAPARITGGPVDYVNPLVGTLSSYELSTGNLYPDISLPWGMNSWSPQTGKNGDGWMYTYTTHKLRGLKQTHQPSPWINDYGAFSLMPTADRPQADEEKRASWFSHFGEEARPYYYKVYLADYNATAELTPTMRCALFRFTYQKGREAYLTVDAYDKGSYIKIIPEERKIVGYSSRNSGGVPKNFRNYFVMQFDRPFTYLAAADGTALEENKTSVEGNHALAVVGFGQTGGAVTVRVGSSFISAEQAEVNLSRELGSRTFDDVMQAGADEWNRWLGRIEVDNNHLDHTRTFYSCLYRALLFPRSFFEEDAQGHLVHYSPFKGTVALHRLRRVGRVPRPLPLAPPGLSRDGRTGSGRVRQHVSRERFPARMGQSRPPQLHGGQQFRLCRGRCLPGRSPRL